MLGDTAVAVHPEDERYAHLVGTEIELPLTGRTIPVVADEHVDPEFGTGAVKVTPAHDPNDFEIGRRHDLPTSTIMDERAVITAHGPFQGLDRFEARSRDRRGAARRGPDRRREAPVHALRRPLLALQDHHRAAAVACSGGSRSARWPRPRATPSATAGSPSTRKEMESRYFGWVDNLHDWCISRQLWWGHRIPVWYGPNGEVVCVGPDEEAPTGEGWTQDTDVLDTWFSSGLWPFSTLGWPEQTPSLEKFYPNSVLVTGYDILFFWVARMMMFGLYAMDGTPPFHTIALHGMVRDQFGKKMSKSFGNAVNPLDWMDAYGSDAVRFTLARGANPGVDVPIGEDWVQGSRNFANKIWNATRFALMNGATVERRAARPPRAVGDRPVDPVPAELGRRRGGRATTRTTSSRSSPTPSSTSPGTRSSTGTSSCPRRRSSRAASRARSRGRVLGEVLDVTLRLLHPIVPFVTETLWTTLTGSESVVIAEWPQPTAASATRRPRREIARVQQVVTEVRRFRSDQGLPAGPEGRRAPARPVRHGLAAHEAAIRQLAAAPAGRGRLQRHRDPAGRRRHRRAGPVRRDRRRGRAQAAGQGPRRRREGEGAGRRQARQRGVPRQGAGEGRGQDPRPAGDGRGGHRPDHRAAGGPAQGVGAGPGQGPGTRAVRGTVVRRPLVLTGGGPAAVPGPARPARVPARAGRTPSRRPRTPAGSGPAPHRRGRRRRCRRG